MMALITWAVSITWKVLVIALLINLFKLMRKGGREAIEGIFETTGMAVKTLNAKLQKWLFREYKEAKEEPKPAAEPKKDEEAHKACDGCPYRDESSAICISHPELCPVAKHTGA